MGSAVKTVQATIRRAGYQQAPVSLLTINGKPPDVIFQKSLDTFAKRDGVWLFTSRRIERLRVETSPGLKHRFS